jgi:transcriptional regulator GlxA family with amidase domain
MYTPINVPPKGKYPEEVAWLREIHERGALVCSVCSGSVVLAEAGLLDDRDAAAHWAYKELFRRHYPKVRLRSELILCRTSEADGVVTAGGVAAWHDLVFYLIARFCGRKQSIETAKVFLLSGHEDGQLPYAMMNRCGSIDDQVVIGCQEWVAENYSRENPVEHMAEHSGLTPRTFARRFRAATGYAPLEYVQMVRVEEAKQMLETDAVAIDDVGEAVGYDDPASFRRIFKRLAGLTPASYRRKFQRIAQIAEPV